MKLTPTSIMVSALLISSSLPIFAKGKADAKPAPVEQPAQAAASPLLGTMQQEMDRELGILGKADPAAYF